MRPRYAARWAVRHRHRHRSIRSRAWRRGVSIIHPLQPCTAWWARAATLLALQRRPPGAGAPRRCPPRYDSTRVGVSAGWLRIMCARGRGTSRRQPGLPDVTRVHSLAFSRAPQSTSRRRASVTDGAAFLASEELRRDRDDRARSIHVRSETRSSRGRRWTRRARPGERIEHRSHDQTLTAHDAPHGDRRRVPQPSGNSVRRFAMTASCNVFISPACSAYSPKRLNTSTTSS